MTPQIKYTTLPTGVTIEYIETGPLGGSPLRTWPAAKRREPRVVPEP